MTADLDFRNAARLGLFQVGLIVGGVLGAAATLRLWNEFGLHGIPWYTEYLRDYGFWLLPLPVVWIALAMSMRQKDGGEVWAYFSGWVVIFALTALALGADVFPWLRLCLLQLSA
jgi:hypothetical protein